MAKPKLRPGDVISFPVRGADYCYYGVILRNRKAFLVYDRHSPSGGYWTERGSIPRGAALLGNNQMRSLPVILRAILSAVSKAIVG